MASYIPRVFLPGSDHYACHMAQARKKSTPATPAPKKPRLSQAEATAMADKMFTRMDRNKDGVISADDMPKRPIFFR